MAERIVGTLMGFPVVEDSSLDGRAVPVMGADPVGGVVSLGEVESIKGGVITIRLNEFGADFFYRRQGRAQDVSFSIRTSPAAQATTTEAQ